MWSTAILTASAAAAAMMLGCTPQPQAVAPTVSEKIYSLTPNSLKVKAGIVAGEVSEMKITERVEAGSGRVASPARLTGKLVLKNVSSDQSVRLLGGKIVYIDGQGRSIPLEDGRSVPTLRAPSQYGQSERLDPGQEASQSLDAEFPAAALQAKRLKDIRVEISYMPSPYKEGALNFPVSVGGQ